MSWVAVALSPPAWPETALVTPSTCWKTPWTPQKHPPAITATSDALPLACSSTTGGGTTRASSAVDRVVTKPTAAASPRSMSAGKEEPLLKDEIMGPTPLLATANRKSGPRISRHYGVDATAGLDHAVVSSHLRELALHRPYSFARATCYRTVR